MPHCFLLASTAFIFAVAVLVWMPHCFQLASTAFSLANVNSILANGLSAALWPSGRSSTAGLSAGGGGASAPPTGGGAAVSLTSGLSHATRLRVRLPTQARKRARLLAVGAAPPAAGPALPSAAGGRVSVVVGARVPV